MSSSAWASGAGRVCPSYTTSTSRLAMLANTSASDVSSIGGASTTTTSPDARNAVTSSSIAVGSSGGRGHHRRGRDSWPAIGTSTARQTSRAL